MSSGNTTLQIDLLTSTVVCYNTFLEVLAVATSSNKILLSEHDCDKSTKRIYGSTTERSRLESIVFNGHNIIMLVEMLATGLPFVGWKVKPDPGD